VTLLTWKRAEDGDGTILRLQEAAGEASQVTIRSQYLAFERAWLCNLLEDNQVEVKTTDDGLGVPIRPFQVLTLRLRTASRVGRKAGGVGFQDDATGAATHE
jgi:alpha-mannosidase